MECLHGTEQNGFCERCQTGEQDSDGIETEDYKLEKCDNDQIWICNAAGEGCTIWKRELNLFLHEYFNKNI